MLKKNMNKIKLSYGICINQCEIINRNSNNRDQLHQGALIRILEGTNSDADKCDKIVIKLYNVKDNNFNIEIFACDKRNTDYVEEALWLYLIGTEDYQTRLRIYNERDIVLRLRCGSYLTIKSYENDSNANIAVQVQLIDSVKEIGIGNFIGVKLKKIPQNSQTMINLYQKHHNPSTNLLLFRIEQLLDVLKDAEQQQAKDKKEFEVTTTNLLQDISNQNSDIWQLKSANENMHINLESTKGKTLYPNLNSYMEDVSKLQLPELHKQTKYTTTLITSIPVTNLNRYSPSKYQEEQAKIALPMTNVSSQYSNVQQSTLFGINESINWQQEVSRPSDESESKSLININKLNENTIYIGKKTYLTSSELEDSTNLKAISPTKPSPVPTKGGNNPQRCVICGSLYDRDTLMLKCLHCICMKCLIAKTNISFLTGNQSIQCPFRDNIDLQCKYELQHSELLELRQKIDELFKVLPRSDDQLPATIRTDNPDDDEQLFECLTDRCNGKWFVSKSGSVNLFRCPICHINNCVHCKVIHDGMTCTDYKKLLKHEFNGNVVQNVSRKLNNLLSSLIPNGATESRKLPDDTNGPDGNESLMKCKTKKCSGQWYILKNDHDTFFKCPVCELYNCAKCNAIHQNQTCEDYEKTKRKSIYKFWEPKN